MRLRFSLLLEEELNSREQDLLNLLERKIKTKVRQIFLNLSREYIG